MTPADNRFYREPTNSVDLSLSRAQADQLLAHLCEVEAHFDLDSSAASDIDAVRRLIADGIVKYDIAARADEASKVMLCPFCGEGEALSLHSCGHHFIECRICFAQGPSGSAPHVAYEGWNSRHEATVLREALVLMVDAYKGDHPTYQKAAMIRAEEALS